MHRFRFFGFANSSGSWQVVESEINHIVRVLRLKQGAEVELCDGCGTVVVGIIDQMSPKKITVRVLDKILSPKPDRSLHLIMGVLKPAVVEEALPFLTELGVDHISFFLQPGIAKSRFSPQKIERFTKIIRGAFKQCKRSWLPTLEYYSSLASCLESIDKDLFRVVLDPESSDHIAKLDFKSLKGVVGVIGGERGLDNAELSFLKENNFVPLRVGKNILRAITASIVFAGHCSILIDSQS
mgnify:CR=1 FL=1